MANLRKTCRVGRRPYQLDREGMVAWGNRRANARTMVDNLIDILEGNANRIKTPPRPSSRKQTSAIEKFAKANLSAKMALADARESFEGLFAVLPNTIEYINAAQVSQAVPILRALERDIFIINRAFEKIARFLPDAKQQEQTSIPAQQTVSDSDLVSEMIKTKQK